MPNALAYSPTGSPVKVRVALETGPRGSWSAIGGWACPSRTRSDIRTVHGEAVRRRSVPVRAGVVHREEGARGPRRLDLSPVDRFRSELILEIPAGGWRYPHPDRRRSRTVRDTIRRALQRQGIDVVSIATDGSHVLEAVRRDRPRRPHRHRAARSQRSGRRLRDLHEMPNTSVIAVTALEDDRIGRMPPRPGSTASSRSPPICRT